MSQGDYIKYKKIMCELSELEKHSSKTPNVLDARKYILYKEYSLENTIINNNTSYDKFVDNDSHIIFGMVKKKYINPPFVLCKDTNFRTYRKTVQPIDAENNPVFSNFKFGTVDKKTRMKWNSIRNSNYCNNCVNI